MAIWGEPPPYRQLSLVDISLAGACKKVSSDSGLGGGFRRVLQFPPPVTTVISRNMAEKVTKN